MWATFSKDHSITISDDGYWVIDGTKTDKQAIGTGVSIKGRVDVYSDSEITDNETSLESYPSGPDAPSELEVGDCWIVTSGTDGDDNDVSGHLFICVATTGTLAQMWQDLGEFKGEKGEDGESNISGIYPAGEGAGYAGGITSAACDGIRAAWHIVSRYRRPEM